MLQGFARLDETALGVALGSTLGIALWTATAFLLIKGGRPIGPTLALLRQYLPLYSVTWRGAVVGLLNGFAIGFILGWVLAYLRNLSLALYLWSVRRKVELSSFDDVFYRF